MPPAKLPHRDAASVPGPVRTEACDLQRPPIVQVAAARTAHDGDAHDSLPVRAADGELMPDDRLMVPVVLLHKSICLFQCNRAYLNRF